MLSFDITDRNIRIIKGTESNGKIRVVNAAEMKLDEAVIMNGHVNDPNRVAATISQVFKETGIADKEAIISISSNQTVFKELMIPPNPKESEFLKNVRMELQSQINIDDSYSVGYTIVGEPEENANHEKLQKVLATACPREVIDSYRSIFRMLGVTLKSVMIGCNAITKILLADAKNKAKMPLLAVQIDANFISLNLYEESQLSFSRFASIDPEDYDNPNDYIYEAVNENISRMLQFARIRGSEDIYNVVFYGDIDASPDLYKRLEDFLKRDEITVSKLIAPPQIHGNQNLKFSIYANAIGAMFKRDKLTEYINLLETDIALQGVAGRVQDNGSFAIIAGVGIGLSVVIVGAVFGVLFGMDLKYKNATKDLKAKLESPDTAAQLQQYDDLQVMKDNVRLYSENINSASDAYKTQPIIYNVIYDAIDEAMETVTDQTDGINESPSYSVDYEDGILTVSVVVQTTEEFSQKYPSNLVQYLYETYGEEASEKENRLFSSVEYESYTLTTTANSENPNDERKTISFDLAVSMLPSELPEIVEETVPEETTADENADSAE
ncbi:MAG: pilus assembly protein PilM [Oscillospiraceae bacterium]|nr:pilus assembly protein PilM [Oscillospiraceae bacterium]